MTRRRDRDEGLLDAFLEDLGSVSPPPDLVQGVARRIRDDQPRRQSRFPTWAVLAAVPVAVVLLTALAVLVGGPKPAPAVATATPSPSVLPEWQVDLGNGRLVLINDGSKLLSRAAVEPIAPDAAISPAIVAGPDADSIIVRFGWSSCYPGGRLEIAGDRRRIELDPTPPASPCAGAAGAAAIALAFREPIDPAGIAFAIRTPPAPAGTGAASPGPTATTPIAVETPGIEPYRFELTLDPAGLTRLPVLVLDQSLGITAQPVEARGNFRGTGDVEITQGSTPNSVVVDWVGGGCDELAEVSIDAARATVTVGTVRLPGGCDAIGFDRAVELTFRDPVDAASLQGRAAGMPSLAASRMAPNAVWFADANHGYVGGRDRVTGAAALAATFDGGKTWTTTAFGWGNVVGLAAVIAPDLVERPIVAVNCGALPNGAVTQPGCTPGVYRLEGVHWVLANATAALAMAARDDTLVVLAAGRMLPNASYPYPPANLLLSLDGGLTWATEASPCDGVTMGTADVALDREARPVVLCEGSRADGSMQRRLVVAEGRTTASAWTTMPALPGSQNMQLDLGAEGFGLAWGLVGSGVGTPAPLYVTRDGGATWTARADVADGDARVVESASAGAGLGAALVFDLDRRADLFLLTGDRGATWTEITAFPAVQTSGQ